MKKFMMATAMALLLATTGCSTFLKDKTPPPTIYALHAAPAEGTALPHGRKPPIISLSEPNMPAGFDTDRIALYLAGGRQLDYLAGAQWPEHLGKVLQNMLIASAPTGGALTVVPPDAATQPDYRLMVTMLDFAPTYAGDAKAAPVIKVTANFRLVSLETDRIVLDTTLTAQNAAASNSQTAIVAGLEALTQQVAAEAYGDITKAAKPPRRKRVETAPVAALPATPSLAPPPAPEAPVTSPPASATPSAPQIDSLPDGVR